MTKILLDTNFILLPFTLKVDIFTELKRIIDNPEIIILDLIVLELEKIARLDKGSDGRAAKATLSYLEKMPLKVKKTVKHLKTANSLSKISSVDDKIVEFAAKNGYLVATQDKLLKEKLKNRDIKIITLRQKKHLIII
ncbi:MAG: hypothetical protein KAQ83_01850 [Nanoarchaeota archaeon]|nr:hypothetical protein [Nanoarchaeota archaeon]